MSLGQHPGMAETVWRFLSWAFPNGTNPSTASVFVAPVKAIWLECTDSGVVRSNKLPATNVGCTGVLYLSIKSFCHCQKVGFVSTGGVTGFVGAGGCGAGTGSCGVAN